MGEIKSTLDLVMEKTRNLSLSPDEKENQKKADFEKRLQGLLQQYADNIESVETLQKRISELQAELGVTDAGLFLEGLFKRIAPGRDNQRWLILLDQIAPKARDAVEKTFMAYEKQRADLVEAAEQGLLAQLASDHGIRGTALKPNSSHDSKYQKRLAALQREIQQQINGILVGLR